MNIDRTTRPRTTRTRTTSSALALALMLGLSGCGTDTMPPPPPPPAGTAVDEGASSAEPTTPAPTTEEPTTEEPTTEETTAEETTTQEGSPEETSAEETGAEDTADAPAPGSATDTVRAYLERIGAGDDVGATAMLSEESRALLGSGEDDVLGDEPWIEGLREDVAAFDRDTECHWIPAEAWPGSGPDVQVVEVTCWGSDAESGSDHAFGVRKVDGSWVVDQDRTDSSTGGTWVEFDNPDWEGTFVQGQPFAFHVTAAAGEPQDITLRVLGREQPAGLTSRTDGDSVVYTAQDGTVGPPGSYNALVTGRVEGSPMVRAHSLMFAIREGS